MRKITSLLVLTSMACSALSVTVPQLEYACEGDILRLSCGTEEVIRITHANYGRSSYQICTNYVSPAFDIYCSSANAKDIISESCDGHQTCDVQVNNGVFSDPCPGTPKYAEVLFKCERAPNVVFACEGTKLNLTCETGEVITVIRANYGRFSLWICNGEAVADGWNLQCVTPNTRDIVSEMCNGNQTCEVQVNNSVFTDPCPGTYKYIELHFVCGR